MQNRWSKLGIQMMVRMATILGLLWQQYKGIITAAVGWSFCGLLIKSIRYDTVPMASLRSIPYAPLGLLVISLLLRKSAHNREQCHWGSHLARACRQVYGSRDWAHWICALSACGSLVCSPIALKYSVGGFAIFMNSSSLFMMVALSGPILNHWPNRKEVAVVGVAFIGLCFLAYAGWVQGDLAGILWGCASALFITASFVAQKFRARGERGTEALESWTLAASLCALLLAPWALIAGLPSMQDLLLIGLLGIVCTFASDVCYTQSIGGVPLIHAMVISRISAALTPVWICWCLGEMPSRWSYVGASIIVLAVFLLAAVQKTAENLPARYRARHTRAISSEV